MELQKSEIATVLVTRFSAVGDVAMTIPVLYSVARSYPQCRFVFVSRMRFGQLFIDKPRNLLFKGVNPDEYKGIVGLRRLHRELCEEFSPQYFADLHDVLRTKMLRIFFALDGVRTERIMKGRMQKWRLIRGKSKEQLTTTFSRYNDVFVRLGFPFTTDFKSLFTEAAPIDDFSSVLPEKGSDKWVGIAPFARHKGKIYPIELMRKVVERLSQQQGIKVICFGNGEQEALVVDGWCRDFNNVISFIGKSNFAGELRLISNLDLMLSMDSANMHIASLVNTPVLSVWGATSPLAGFLGWGQSETDCIQLPLDCRPCSIFGDKPCKFGDYRCMDIQPQEIAATVIKRLKM